MDSLEDLGSVGHALSALSYGRDTAACCAAEMAVHACERVSQSTRGDLVLFLMAAPANGRSAVVLYGGQHAQQCTSSEQNNIATGMRLIMGSLRAAAPPAFAEPTPARTPSHPPPASPRPPSAPRRDLSGTSGRCSPSSSSTPHDDLCQLQRAGGMTRSSVPAACRPAARASQPRRAPPNTLTTRPMASFPGLLSFSPMVGAGFVDGRKDFVVADNNTVTVPPQLSDSLLGRLRERFTNDRALCKHFLQLIRVAVNDFLTQLPLRNRTSTQASKYLSMTPIAVTKVAIKYTDMDEVRMAIAPVLTNTGDVDPIAFLGLVCYMVHIKDPAFMWLIEEICSGAQPPPTRKGKRSGTSAVPGSDGGGANTGAVRTSGRGGTNTGATGNSGGGAANAGPPGTSGGGGANAGASGNSVGGGENTGAAGNSGRGGANAGPPGNSAGGGANAGAAGNSVGGGENTGAVGNSGRGGANAGPPGNSGGGGANVGAAGNLAGCGANTGAAGNSGAASSTGQIGAPAPGVNDPAADVAAAGGSRPAAATWAGGSSVPAAVGTATVQLARQEMQRRGGPLSFLPASPQRWSLFADGVVVRSGVLLPMRSHGGRDPLASHIIVACQVAVVEDHEEDAEGFVIVPASGSSTTPLTLGAAALSGCDFLWNASCVGYV